MAATKYRIGTSLPIPRFSPLFIGSMAATGTATFSWQILDCFSPLFIGSMAATSTRYVHPAGAWQRFSPLFIGSMAATGDFRQ